MPIIKQCNATMRTAIMSMRKEYGKHLNNNTQLNFPFATNSFSNVNGESFSAKLRPCRLTKSFIQQNLQLLQPLWQSQNVHINHDTRNILACIGLSVMFEQMINYWKVHHTPLCHMFSKYHWSPVISITSSEATSLVSNQTRNPFQTSPYDVFHSR